MRKSVLFFIAILLLCSAVWGFMLYNKPHGDVGNKVPDVVITAADLYKAYNANEGDANKQFLNKIIAVSGKAAEVNKTDSTYIILLKNAEDAGGVSCSIFTKSNINNKIKEGELLTIKGKCTGFLMDVALTDCVIEHQ